MEFQLLVSHWGSRVFPSSCGVWAEEAAAAGSGIGQMPQEHQAQESGQALGKQCAGRCCATAADTGLSGDPVSKAAGPGQQKPFSATPAHSSALPQAAPGSLVSLQQFCWPMVLSLTFAQLMILADGMGQPRLFFVGSCASDTVRAQPPSQLSRVDQQGHIC